MYFYQRTRRMLVVVQRRLQAAKTLKTDDAITGNLL